MATTTPSTVSVTISPDDPKMLVLDDRRGNSVTLPALQFSNLTRNGMDMNEIIETVQSADKALESAGVPSGRREVYDQLYGTRATAANMRNGYYLITCTNEEGRLMNAYSISALSYRELHEAKVSDSQIYGAVVDGVIQSEQLPYDPLDEDLLMPEFLPDFEMQEQLNPRITDAAISGNILSITADGHRQNLMLSPRELALYAQGSVPLNNIANDMLMRMDVDASLLENFERNMRATMETGPELTMRR